MVGSRCQRAELAGRSCLAVIAGWETRSRSGGSSGDRMRAAQEQALPPHLNEVRPVDVDGGAAVKAQLREVRRVNAVRRVERRQLRRQAAWDRWLSGQLRSVSASGSRHTSGKNPVREVR